MRPANVFPFIQLSNFRQNGQRLLLPFLSGFAERTSVSFGPEVLMRGRAVWQLTGLITRRSLVQIQSPRFTWFRTLHPDIPGIERHPKENLKHS